MIWKLDQRFAKVIIREFEPKRVFDNISPESKEDVSRNEWALSFMNLNYLLKFWSCKPVFNTSIYLSPSYLCVSIIFPLSLSPSLSFSFSHSIMFHFSFSLHWIISFLYLSLTLFSSFSSYTFFFFLCSIYLGMCNCPTFVFTLSYCSQCN